MRRPTRDRRHKAQGMSDRSAARDASAVYGVLPVLELLRSDSRRVDRLMVADGANENRLAEVLRLAREKQIVVHRVPRQKLNDLVGPDANHQGVTAMAASASFADADDIINKQADGLYLILDGVEDPRNFGAILRTAECAGVNGVLIPERRSVGLTETVAKSSAGATEYVSVARVPNLNRFIDELKQHGIWVVGSSADADMDHTEWDWTRPTALVLGGEGRGLHRLVSEKCDVLVKIPMYGKIRSLNVSVAAGVILFEARRQRALKTD